jgi:hypothetical protein
MPWVTVNGQRFRVTPDSPLLNLHGEVVPTEEPMTNAVIDDESREAAIAALNEWINDDIANGIAALNEWLTGDEIALRTHDDIVEPLGPGLISMIQSNEATSEQEQSTMDEELYPFYYEPPLKYGLHDSIPARAVFSASGLVIRDGKSFTYEMMLEDGWHPKHYTDPSFIYAWWHYPMTSAIRQWYVDNLPFSPDMMWHFEALNKLRTERWRATGFEMYGWYADDPELRIHYAHVSRIDPTKVAYIPDQRHGIDGRELRTKPGRYLNKYAPDDIDPAGIKYMTMEYQKKHTPSLYTLKWARTEDDIEHVYENGPSSCMVVDREDRYITSDIHPVRVYATPDVAVAYLENNKGRIKQRTVCNMLEKQFTTIYGEGTLQEMLEAEGFKWGTLHGCRIKKIEDTFGKWLMPYMDNSIGVNDWDSQYWMATEDYEFGCETTSGYLDDDRTSCADCGDLHDADNMTWVNAYSDALVCGSCIENYQEIRTHAGWRWIYEDQIIRVYESADQEIYKDIWENEKDDYNYDDVTDEYYTYDAYNYLIELREREDDESTTQVSAA